MTEQLPKAQFVSHTAFEANTALDSIGDREISVVQNTADFDWEVTIVEKVEPNEPKPTNIAGYDAAITDDYLMGKFVPSRHPAFTRIERKYASAKGMYMRKEAYDAFLRMHAAAKADGINLEIKSATRPYSHQKKIWEGKWSGRRRVDGKNLSKAIPFGLNRAYKILEFSSMPGTSRHHWGTDIDINALDDKYFQSGKGKREYEWLLANAGSFGFCQTYTKKDNNRQDGYREEKWHWSYTPISKVLTKQYEIRFNDGSIRGFKGASHASDIEVVRKYVLGVNQDCR